MTTDVAVPVRRTSAIPHSTSHISYLDPQTLASISSIELRARMAVEGLMTGMHRSPYHGFSVEFAQHRPYTPGDDTRFLDWKVYARTDKLYLKQYQQETNLDMVLLVDGSGSMGYTSRGQVAKSSSGQGKSRQRANSATRPLDHLATSPAPWSKFDHAATIAAAMAHLALKQQDRVGLTLFADDLRSATRLSNSQGHWRSIVESLEQQSTELQTTTTQAGAERSEDPDQSPIDFAALFDRVVAKLSQRSLVVPHLRSVRRPGQPRARPRPLAPPPTRRVAPANPRPGRAHLPVSRSQ